MPKEEREAIEHEDEIFGYMRQSRISEKNVSRLEHLAESPNTTIAELAKLVLQVAEVKPHKRRRLKALAQKRPDLLEKLEETGLIMSDYW